MTQRVFGPDQRGGKWYFYAYVDGQQTEWGPYSTEDFAKGARDAIERRLNGGPVARPLGTKDTEKQSVSGDAKENGELP